ncbi:uncharacterized protein EI90DRAFT_2435079 [Cantharellus anzutake]|uniref:uncharacterized protein n=1 Tax=Cantharellus anzutake TaxID=1750568 RepID=UPI001905DCC8|nr:uncharacterized protein EI90DRAFT_2435079 [Cantharellus anzutake]KAF8338960.1 hypothetical protein EI90DRAFT_2435079 [Cantharellus anzutake]
MISRRLLSLTWGLHFRILESTGVATSNDRVGIAEFQCNSSKPGATRVSPFYANYRYHKCVISPDPNRLIPAASDLVEHLAFIQEELHSEQESEKRRHNKCRAPALVPLPNDLAMVLRRNIQTTRLSNNSIIVKSAHLRWLHRWWKNVHHFESLPPLSPTPSVRRKLVGTLCSPEQLR